MSKGLGSISMLTRGLLFHGNIRVLGVTSLFTGLYVSMLSAILQPFVVLSLGFGLPVLGILQSIGGRPSGLASSLVQPFSGHFADVVGRKVLIVSGSAVAICSMASFLTAAFTRSLLPLAVGYFLFGLSLMSSPATQAMIAESVLLDQKKVNVAFTVVFFFTQLPGAFVPFAAGFLTESLGYYVIFAGAALLESANLIVLITQLKETGQTRSPGARPSSRSRFPLQEAVRLPPGFLRILVPFAMDAFSYNIGGAIIYGMWVKQFGFSSGDIGLIVGALSVSVVVCQYPAARFLLKMGPRKSLAFSEFLNVVVSLGWAVTASVPVFIVLAVVFGASVATWVPALQSLLMSSAPPEQRGSLGGKFAAYRGLLAVPAPIIWGFLFITYGYLLPVTLGMIGETFATLAILRLVPETPRPAKVASPDTDLKHRV